MNKIIEEDSEENEEQDGGVLLEKLKQIQDKHNLSGNSEKIDQAQQEQKNE